MKKLLAVLLSLVMMFSVVALPASAATETAGEISVESIEKTLEDAFDVFEAIFNLVHKIVHGFSEIFDFDCPFCDGKADDDTAGDGSEGGSEDGSEDDAQKPVYETAFSVIGSAFANKDLAFKLDYPQNVDAAYVVAVPLKSLTIDSMATANVKTAIVLEKDAVVGKIVFTDETVYNYYHNVEGFKLIINNSGVSVPVVLKGEVRVGSTVITAANIGNYIEGPYTVHVA
ncbi:MAG: hypothetical protein IJB93_03805 [Clostridia bacterium]|nr:hypothetical protein [Clostridia bacterium]